MSDTFKLSTGQTILGIDGKPAANGQVHFYDKETGEYAPVYGDSGQSVTLRQPIQADSSGVLPTIYLDDAIAYRAVVTDRQNEGIRVIDDLRRHREGIKQLGGVEALKRYCGKDPFVLVASEDGCPVFYKRLSGCDLPEEHLPDVVRAECGCDCSVAWQLCRCEPDICAMETADLTCDHHVLVQACSRDPATGGFANQAPQCAEQEGPPPVQKASIGALLSAGAKCLPSVCIPHDAPELALTGSGLVYGDREPQPVQNSGTGAFAGCLRLFPALQSDQVSRHVRLDQLAGVAFPQIGITNLSPCSRQYEIRALSRLNRARDNLIGDPNGVPSVAANFQTRLAKLGDVRLDDVWTVADYTNTLNWLEDFSIADSTMGAFRSGLPWSTGQSGPIVPGFLGANGYTENTLIVPVGSGVTVKYALKFHIYWDMNASPADLQVAERIHFGTRIIARRVR